MYQFQLAADFHPAGDQPQAIEKLVAGLTDGYKHQVLLGVTGSGKTFTIANVIAQIQKPTLVLSHNKTLAAQLYTEFSDFFPENAVEYFVSYYDYYQPEAYIPRTDTYIEKETDINEEIDKLRHSATRSLLSRPDVIITASVSCIYGLGAPEEYYSFVVHLKKGERTNRDRLARRLVEMQYERNDVDFTRGRFRIRGDTLEIQPAYEDLAIRVEFWGDEIERITEIDPLTGELVVERDDVEIYPAKHFVTTHEKLMAAIATIQEEMTPRVAELKSQEKLLEAQRIEARTNYDLEMLRETGYCTGVENYSRHLTQRPPGSPPWTLIDYFPDDFLLIVDESHMTIPQVRGMYHGDRSRKEVLVEHGFRLPSALDNRPLNFTEFESHINQAIYTSATPGPYEYQHSRQVVEQVIRPTGLLDPTVEVKPTKGQIDDLMEQINKRVDCGERVLVTTLTKRMAEELADYLREMGIKTHYLHSEVHTLERVEILRELRFGVYDVVVGINLLREGLDLPEVSLVAILDADKEGFLRSDTALIQTMGRAARHGNGHVIMYADYADRKPLFSMDAEIEDDLNKGIISKKLGNEFKAHFSDKFAFSKNATITKKGAGWLIVNNGRRFIVRKEEGRLNAYDAITKSMENSIKETQRRRKIQMAYNREHGITPEGIKKAVKDITDQLRVVAEPRALYAAPPISNDEIARLIKSLESQMKTAAKNLEFEKAALLRDQIAELRKSLV